MTQVHAVGPTEKEITDRINTVKNEKKIVRVGEGVAIAIAFAGAVTGLFRILRGDRQGALVSGGISLAAIGATVGLDRFVDNYFDRIASFEEQIVVLPSEKNSK